jgi:DNA-binding MarR family transcriptional regulator
VGDKERLIARIEQADETFLRLTATGQANPLMSVDLTMQQLRTLMILSFHGSASGQELSDGLGVHISTVTGIINRLVSRHLVERGEDPNDRRVRRVKLSAEGKHLMQQVRDAGRLHKRRLLQKLDAKSLAQMADVMDALNVAAESEDGQAEKPSA